MASSKSTTNGIASSVSKLSLKTGPKATKAKKAPVADSWEDEDVSSGSEYDGGDDDRRSQHSSSEQEVSAAPLSKRQTGTSAPPPTPMSPTYGSSRLFSTTESDRDPYDVATGSGPSETRPRPEKTDAVARRMIAGALGLKAPRLTEEQKAYDRAVREKEKRRKEEEKELQKKREAEALKAKQAVWED